MKKTYAVRGLLEWQVALEVTGAILRICFSGGSMGSNGVIPAKYITDNEAIQHIIEQSAHFKSGRIILLSIETPAEKKEENPSGNQENKGTATMNSRNHGKNKD
ncbi:MAG: hypothetical protein J1F12_00940 [Muribaculaceae bacterium]|nr:hypothetical protein [Muribaculaceae bacterium]